MLREFLNYSKPILIFVPILGFFHYFLSQKFPKITTSFFSLLSLYVFLGITTLIGLLLLMLVKNRDRGKFSMAFAAFGGLKMLSSVLFLLPVFYSKKAEVLQAVLIFFVPYFIVLALDVFITIKLLNSDTFSS